jgi:hypothetical protein
MEILNSTDPLIEIDTTDSDPDLGNIKEEEYKEEGYS